MSDAQPAVARVAVLSDVHGNAVALEAVLRELPAAEPDVIVFGGDLTWGSLPEETWALVESLPSAVFVRGNAERALFEAADRLQSGSGDVLTARERWMVGHHSPSTLAQLDAFLESTVVEIDSLGTSLFCHGSPRSDEELVTPVTPEARMRALLEGVTANVLVTAHTHIQFDREVAGVRSINPGSVGMPYEGRSGVAYWAVLGPDVELLQTEYELDEAVRRYRATDDPSVEQMVELLIAPPSRDELIQDAEAREFAG